MTEPNPGEEFADWLREHTGPSPAECADLEEALASDDPGKAFSAFIGAALNPPTDAPTTTESETH